MRVLVTGASGYIGRYVLPHLLTRGHDVHVISRGRTHATSATVHTADLLSPGAAQALIAGVRPDAVLHLAWEATPGVYWTSPDNPAWARATAALARAARDAGATRFVGIGSSAEYDWTSGHCDEEVTAERPATPYGMAKLDACNAVRALNAPGFSAAWARVFFLFGGAEHPSRLVPSVALALRRGEPALCSHGEQVRDFMHVSDVAAGLAAVFESTVTGVVNIASGEAHRVRDVIEGLAARLGQPTLVRLGARQTEEPLRLTASAQRLQKEVGWHPQLSFEGALDAAAAHWQLDGAGSQQEGPLR